MTSDEQPNSGAELTHEMLQLLANAIDVCTTGTLTMPVPHDIAAGTPFRSGAAVAVLATTALLIVNPGEFHDAVVNSEFRTAADLLRWLATNIEPTEPEDDEE